jgi:hypothetical protein
MKILPVLVIGAGLMTSSFAADPVELLQNGSFANDSIDPWKLILLDGAAGTTRVIPDGPDKKPAVVIDITAASQGGQPWHVGLNQGGLNFSKGKSYRLSFRVKGSNVPSLTAIVGPSHPPYGSLPGVERKAVAPTDTWQQVTHDFVPTEDESDARILFYSFNVSGASISLADISLVEVPSP